MMRRLISMDSVSVFLTAVLLLVGSGVLTACQSSVQTYSGPERAASQVATIVPENAFNRARSDPLGAPSSSAEIRVRVNGQSLGGKANTFTVLPGRHVLQVVYVDRPPRLNGRYLMTQSVALPLHARAGGVYAIRGHATWTRGKPTVRLFAVNGQSGTTVAQVTVPVSRTRVAGDEDGVFDTD